MATMPRRLPLAGGLSAGEGVSDMGRPARWATWATWITNRRLARGRCRERERERPEHEEIPGSSGVHVQSQKVERMAAALVPGGWRRSPFSRRGRVHPPVGARILSRHANQRAVMGRDGCAGTRLGAWQTGRTARTAHTLQAHKSAFGARDKLRQHAPIVAWRKPKP